MAVTGTTGRLAQQLRLDRAARTAGEAFAFNDYDEPATGPSRLLPLSGIGLVFLLLAALVAVSIGF
ncbi:MAG: hypothetical protein ACJ8DD_14865 [Microvirga sp.]